MSASVAPLFQPVRSLCRAFFCGLEMERLKGIAAVAWGVYVIALDSFDSNPTFTYLVATAAPITGADRAEWLWGGLIAAAGATQLVGLWRDVDWARMLGAIVAGTMWLFLGACFMAFNPKSTTGIIYGQMALACFAIYFQVGTGRRPTSRAADAAGSPTPLAPTA